MWETTPGFGEEPLLDCLWSSIDEAIALKECDVYRCMPGGCGAARLGCRGACGLQQQALGLRTASAAACLPAPLGLRRRPDAAPTSSQPPPAARRSYKSDMESDPFGEKGSVWSFNYFFYNRKLKVGWVLGRGLHARAAGSSMWGRRRAPGAWRARHPAQPCTPPSTACSTRSRPAPQRILHSSCRCTHLPCLADRRPALLS